MHRVLFFIVVLEKILSPKQLAKSLAKKSLLRRLALLISQLLCKKQVHLMME